MIVVFVHAKAKCDRAIALKAAYEWGETVRANGSSLMMEHALFIAQYGIDQEAQIHFEAGYAGIAATDLEQVKKAIMQPVPEKTLIVKSAEIFDQGDAIEGSTTRQQNRIRRAWPLITLMRFFSRLGIAFGLQRA